MAKFTSALITTASGKVGGLSFSKNASGPFMRRTCSPRDPKSLKQISKRNFLAYLAQHWKTIGSANMSAWQALAVAYGPHMKKGISTTLTGFQMYSMINLNLIMNGLAQNDVPPNIDTNIVEQIPGTALSAYYLDATVHIMLSFTANQPANTSLVIASCGPVSSGCNYPKGFKVLGSMSGLTSSGTNITALYKAVFGILPILNDTIYVKVWQLDEVNGWLSPKAVLKCNVTAHS